MKLVSRQCDIYHCILLSESTFFASLSPYILPVSGQAFPVIDSTLSPAHLAGWLAEGYGFTEVSCSLLKTNMNHSYRVTADGSSYILRVYNHAHRSYVQVHEEVALLNKLKVGVSVSYPIRNAIGQFISTINAPEGERVVVLFSFADGRKQRHLSVELNHNIGIQIGRMHNVTKGQTINRSDYSVETLVKWAYAQAANYISAGLEEMKAIQNSVQALSVAFSRYPLRRGIVHLDIWYDNMAITDDGQVTLFDFDNCGNGWLILDVGYYCMQLFYTEPDKAQYEEKKKAFLDGYRSATPLPHEELEVIPYAGLAIWTYYLGVQAQRFDNFANIFLSENYVRMYIGRVKDWMTYHNIAMPA